MMLNLARYAARIGYPGPWTPNLKTLSDLHLAHATHIPFENLDVLLRRPIRLDLEGLSKKLIDERRGGYCFEQNSLFAAVLESTGFRLIRLAARVRMGASSVRPRTHMLLLVSLDGEQWLADVGFGGDGLLLPVRFQPGEEVAHFAWKYRIVAEGSAYVLEAARPEGWLDLYSFTLDEQYAVDYEVANHFTATHPQSPFVRTLMVQRPEPERRLTLLNRRLIERLPDRTLEIPLPDEEAVLNVLADRFGLYFPPGTRFPFEEAAPASVLSGRSSTGSAVTSPAAQAHRETQS
jgi:N-hydroxyarylamine O-acetyltransferase